MTSGSSPSGSFGFFWSVAGEFQCCWGVCGGERGGVQRGQLSYNSLSLSRNFQQKQQVKLGSKSSSDFEAKTPEVYISI
jgi:hypothetical protein